MKSLAADRFEKVLAFSAIALLVAAATAVVRGEPEWSRVPELVWWHLATIGVALALTPVMLLRKRGDTPHRWLGWIWVSTMFATALISLNLRMIGRGHFSVIHVLSFWTIIQVPLLVWRARQHDIARHRSAVRGMTTGALLIAGFFTFPFGRLLGHWLFG